MVFCTDLGTRRMEVCNPQHWAMGIALQISVVRPEALRAQEASTLEVFSDSQATFCQRAQLDPVPGHHLARAVNWNSGAHCTHSNDVTIHWVLGH